MDEIRKAILDRQSIIHNQVDLIEKGKKVPIGTRSKHAGKDVVKTANGWRPVKKGDLKKEEEKVPTKQSAETNDNIYWAIGGGDRKVSDIEDVTAELDLATDDSEFDDNGFTSKQIKAALDALPEINIPKGQTLYDLTLSRNEQFHLLEHQGEHYFIDTQGYDYARYISKIKGYSRKAPDLSKTPDGKHSSTNDGFSREINDKAEAEFQKTGNAKKYLTARITTSINEPREYPNLKDRMSLVLISRVSGKGAASPILLKEFMKITESQWKSGKLSNKEYGSLLGDIGSEMASQK